MSKNSPVKRGEITEVDADGTRYRVKFHDEDGVQSFWLSGPSAGTTGMKQRGAMFKKGAQVWCLVDWNGEDGCIVQGVYNDKDKSPTTAAENDHTTHEDGAVDEYDPVTHVSRLDMPAGSRLVNVGGTKMLMTPGGIIVNKPIVLGAVADIPLRGRR